MGNTVVAKPSELTPLTFTHLLNKYKKIKNQIPIYKYRSEDFWNEYWGSNLPVEYRIE